MKEVPFSPPKRNQPVWKHVERLLKAFRKKPKIINLNDEMPKKAIFVANHVAMNGPLTYSLFLPYFHVTWGAYQMLGNYNMRYLYLRDVYFRQKRNKNKFASRLLARFDALFSIYFYRGIKVLPSYPDGRLVSTIKHSIACLEEDTSVLIFPEDSDHGYKDVMTKFFGGFVTLAERYRKKHNGDEVDICPMYYSKSKHKIIIGKCSKLSDYPNMTRDQVAEEFRNQVNNLYFDYIFSDNKDAGGRKNNQTSPGQESNTDGSDQ